MHDQWIQFTMGGEHYVHPVGTIKEVMRYQLPIPVPGAPDAVEGILNIRGEVITVFSGHKILGLQPEEAGEDSRIIAFDTDRGQFGVSVDGVEGIVGLSMEEVEADGHTRHSKLIQGTTHRDDALLILIDFTGVFEESG